MTHMQENPGGPAAGWYPDPFGQPQLRWWNGVRWGEETQEAPAPAAASPSWPQQPGYGQPGQQPGMAPYGQAPPGPGAYGPGMYGTGVPAMNPASTGNGYSTAGIVLGAIAVLVLPIIFGPAGLIFGAIARSKGEPRANTALVVAGAGMVLGFIIGALFFSAVRGF